MVEIPEHLRKRAEAARAKAEAAKGVSTTDGSKETEATADPPLESPSSGDEKIPAISAASIIAKVARDKYITRLAKNFLF